MSHEDLTGFDFASSEVDESLVRQLHRCEFIANADNVTAKRVRFFSTVELVNALEKEKALESVPEVSQ